MTTEETSKTNTPTFSTQSFDAGQKLAGCYTLQRKLTLSASEGITVAWVARDEELQKEVSLYFLPDSVVNDSRAMSELRQEVRRNRQMIHPHIVRVLDLVEEPDWAAISMEYVEGESLAARLKKKPRQVFDVSEIKNWVAELCQTIEDAHKIDLLHRDIALENLIVAKSGTLFVANFGLTRCLLDSLGRSGQKIQGDGNLAYMSPQQLDGERAVKSDDIYSLGAVLYELLTGKPPFHSGELVSQIRKSVPPPIAKRRAELGRGGELIPENWEKAVAACLEKKIELRPKSATDLLAKLAIEKNVATTAATETPEAEILKPEPSQKRSDPAKYSSAAKTIPAQRPAIPADATVISKSPVSSTPQPAKPETSTSAKPAEATKMDAPAKPADQKKSEVQKPREAAGTEPQKPLDIKKGATTPSGFPLAAFVEVEAGAGSRNAKSKFPLVGVAAAIVLIGIGVVGYLMSNKDSLGEQKSAGFTPPVAPWDSQITPAKNQSAMTSRTTAEKTASAAPDSENRATENTAKKTGPMLTAQAGTPKPSEAAPTTAVKPDASSKIAQAQQIVAEKAHDAEVARMALANAEKALAEKSKAQQAAQAAIQEAQTAASQKSAAAAAAQKAADEALNTQKAKAEAQKKAETDAEDAQKTAAEKARLAVEARKAAEDSVQQAKEQQAQQQRAAAEAQEIQKVVAEKQRLADEAAKAAAEADAARQQQAQALKLAETEAAQAQAAAQKIAAAEEARKAAEKAEEIRLARAKERERLEQQAAAASKAAAEAQRLADAARKAAEDAERMGKESEIAQQKAEAAAREVSNNPAAAAGAPGEMAALVKPAESATPAPVVQVRVPNSKSKIDKSLVNGLGMKFAPVGDVLFCVWQTRVQDFNAFVKATGYKSETWHPPSFKQDSDHPMVNVSWNDALAFCKWLTEKEQKEGSLAQNQIYRLPTDLEWSKAVGLPEEKGRTPEARDLDVPDVYPWGTDWPPPQGAGNYTGEETGSDVAIKNYDDGYAWTSPVGSFKPNKFGLYDMGGNVWQWCMDWWSDDHKARVLRGASWYNGALKLSLLSSCRIHAAPDSSTDNYGFRVVIANGSTKK